MTETTLWKHLRPILNQHGKFQKVSDRFTPGIPDVLGCLRSMGVAIELKELKGVKILKTKYRPGQLDWLEEWAQAGGGRAWIIATHGQTVYVLPWFKGYLLESGIAPADLEDVAQLTWKKTRTNLWSDFVALLL